MTFFLHALLVFAVIAIEVMIVMFLWTVASGKVAPRTYDDDDDFRGTF